MVVKYDFTFANLVNDYLQNRISKKELLSMLDGAEASEVMYKHAMAFNTGYPIDSKTEFIDYLLQLTSERIQGLSHYENAINYAKEHVADSKVAEKIALEYLPEDFVFSGTLYFVCGYGSVAYGQDCCIDLADVDLMNNPNEIKCLAIHELHHVGFIAVKDGYMPAPQSIKTYGDVANIIEYMTHLEGMGTYAPLATFERNLIDKPSESIIANDYRILRDDNLLIQYEEEYFGIYSRFRNNPDNLLAEADLHKISAMSGNRRLWYIVGAHMAKTIDEVLGRHKLINTIAEQSSGFVAAYLDAKKLSTN